MHLQNELTQGRMRPVHDWNPISHSERRLEPPPPTRRKRTAISEEQPTDIVRQTVARRCSPTQCSHAIFGFRVTPGPGLAGGRVENSVH